MKSLTELQRSYANSLKTLTSSSAERKLAAEKKDDEANHWKDKYSNFETEKKVARQAFPLSSNMFVLSGLFWIAIITIIYLIISYGIIYVRIVQESDLDGTCTHLFSTVKEENIKIVENYTDGDAGPYLARLKPPSEEYPMDGKSLPPFVTAVTSSQFYQVQGLIQHLQTPTNPDAQLIIYDLGLYKKEKELLKKYCQCEVRDFDYQSYPLHVSYLETYAWRPIILATVLKEHGSVIYLEPTTRFKTPASPNMLRMRGSKSFFVWDHQTFTSFVAYTDYGMFSFFKEHRCTFKESSLLSPEVIVLYRTEAMWTELMKPWLKCALNQNCISPKNARYSGCFDIRRPRTTGCHRYDMSALTLVLNRGSQYSVGTDKMMGFRLTYTDDSETQMFPEQPWTFTQILAILLSPVLIVVLYKFVYKRRRGYRFF